MNKLTVLNRALANTGNTLLTVLNDGTDEWTVADQAFGEAIDDLISRHNWPFAQVSEVLVAAAAADNPSQRFDTAYQLPTGVVHLKAVLTDGVPTTAYELVGVYLCLDNATALAEIAIEGYAMPNDAIWHPQATKILTMYVEAGCLRGLNEDFGAADRREQAAEFRLMEARPRVDRQNPGHNTYVSSVAYARRQRMGG